MEKDGGWIFISHSHQDIGVVREIRNQLEEAGFEPLLFFLKCLNDDDEIESLIKREIEAREWFLYVESENARKSKWVRSEREFIQKLSGKKVFSISVNEDIKKQLNRITRQLKIFISYAHEDRTLFEVIKKALLKREFLVFDPAEIAAGEFWRGRLKKEMDSVVREGFVLILLTENVGRSKYVDNEIEGVIAAGGKIVPICVGKATMSKDWSGESQVIQGLHIDSEPSQEQLDEVIDTIEHWIQYYDSDFTMPDGFQSAKTIQYPEVAMIPDYTFWDCDNLEVVQIPASVSHISDKAFRKDQNILIICERNSYAEQYCIQNNLRYQITEEK